MSVLFEKDFLTGTERHFHQDGDDLIIETRTDIEPILRDAHEARKGFGKGIPRYGGDGGTQHRVATLPLSVVLMLREKGIDRNQTKFKRWLNGPGAIYKTRPGTV